MTVFRLVLAGALLGLCSLLGARKAARLARRANALQEFLTFVRHLEVLIRVHRLPIPHALGRCATRFEGRWTGQYAGSLAQGYGQGQPSLGLWGGTLAALATEREDAAALTAEDRQTIGLFGDQLGKSDLRTIADNYTFLTRQLQDGIDAARADCHTKGRLYRTIGTLTGLAAAVVIA